VAREGLLLFLVPPRTRHTIYRALSNFAATGDDFQDTARSDDYRASSPRVVSSENPEEVCLNHWNLLLVGCRVFLLGWKYLGEPGLPRRSIAGPMNQTLRFERLKEFKKIGKELRTGNREILSECVRDLVDGLAILQHLPDSQSDRIEAEANSLLNVQQNGSILRRSLSDAGWDHHFLERNPIFHESLATV
jgi:hypothetical protein